METFLCANIYLRNLLFVGRYDCEEVFYAGISLCWLLCFSVMYASNLSLIISVCLHLLLTHRSECLYQKWIRPYTARVYDLLYCCSGLIWIFSDVYWSCRTLICEGSIFWEEFPLIYYRNSVYLWWARVVTYARILFLSIVYARATFVSVWVRFPVGIQLLYLLKHSVFLTWWFL